MLYTARRVDWAERRAELFNEHLDKLTAEVQAKAEDEGRDVDPDEMAEAEDIASERADDQVYYERYGAEAYNGVSRAD
jgi:hypothetical protein